MLRKSHLFYLMISSIACCTLNWRKQSSKDSKGDGTDREKFYEHVVRSSNLRTDLQLNSLKKADFLGAIAVYGLFSEAGYVDGGQTIVYILLDGSAKVERIDPGASSVSKTIILSAETAGGFVNKLSDFKTLSDYERPSFDGIRHEYVVFAREKSEEPLKLSHRVFIMTLQEGKDAEPYQALLKVFTDLQR